MNKLHEETRRKNTRTIQLLPYLSHDDLCRLSRKFNQLADLATTQDNRINQWLREAIAKAEAHEAAIARAGGKT